MLLARWNLEETTVFILRKTTKIEHTKLVYKG